MASVLPISSLHYLTFLAFVLVTTILAEVQSPAHFSKRASMNLEEKMTHLHFYFHDIVSGPNATAVEIISPPKPTPWAFGKVRMIDNLLTEGPEPTSRPVGQAQGMYAFAGQDELAFLMAMNLAFMEGLYNGSVLTVLGRNPPLYPVREMPVVGGSGVFRLARGYALAHTHWLDVKTGDAVVEYNVYVIHL